MMIKSTEKRNIYRPREKNIRKRFFLFAGAGFLLGIVFVGFCYALLNANWFKVKTVHVGDTVLALPDDIISSLEVNIASDNKFLSLLGADNTLFWKFSGDISKIQRLPEVRGVSVDASIFKRSVNINVSERKVKSVLCKERMDKCFGIDEEGIPFVVSPNVEGGLILKIIDKTGHTAVLGIPYFKDLSWLRNILETLSLMKENNLVPKEVRIEDEEVNEWKAVMSSGIEFRFALSFVPEDFGSVISDILKKVDFSGIQYFDFTVENRVYYK